MGAPPSTLWEQNMRWVRMKAWLAAFVLGWCGCGDGGGPSAPTTVAPGTKPAPAARRPTIAVIPKGTLHEFWKSVHAGAVKAQRELGNVDIIWKGPTREEDREAQIQLVENFTNQGASAIVIAPNDRRGLVRPIELAREKGLPVVVIDSGLDSNEIQSYIATDNYHGGALAARHLAKILSGKGNLILLRYQTGSESTEQREKGFLDTIKEFPGLTMLSDNLQAGGGREAAMATAENLLTQFGDKIDGWFCPCEPITFGTLRAVDAKGLAGKIKIVGFDAGDEVVTALRKGEIAALVLQNPMQMGYLGVKTAAAALRGETVPAKVSTGEFLITRENMDEPQNKELLTPDLKPWLEEKGR